MTFYSTRARLMNTPGSGHKSSISSSSSVSPSLRKESKTSSSKDSEGFRVELERQIEQRPAEKLAKRKIRLREKYDLGEAKGAGGENDEEQVEGSEDHYYYEGEAEGNYEEEEEEDYHMGGQGHEDDEDDVMMMDSDPRDKDESGRMSGTKDMSVTDKFYNFTKKETKLSTNSEKITKKISTHFPVLTCPLVSDPAYMQHPRLDQPSLCLSDIGQVYFAGLYRAIHSSFGVDLPLKLQQWLLVFWLLNLKEYREEKKLRPDLTHQNALELATVCLQQYAVCIGTPTQGYCKYGLLEMLQKNYPYVVTLNGPNTKSSSYELGDLPVHAVGILRQNLLNSPTHEHAASSSSENKHLTSPDMHRTPSVDLGLVVSGVRNQVITTLMDSVKEAIPVEIAKLVSGYMNLDECRCLICMKKPSRGTHPNYSDSSYVECLSLEHAAEPMIA